MGEVTFSCLAYSKIMLHAAKYPHCSVNGLLLSKIGACKGKDIEIVDAVPLFHIAINLIPMAEIAITQIEQKVAQQDLLISGYYVAHENFKEASIDKSIHRISDKIADYFPSACLAIVENQSINFSHMECMALRVLQHSDGKYKPIDIQKVYLDDKTLAICSSLAEGRMSEELFDFDNHLDDVCIDFMNTALNKKIEMYRKKYEGMEMDFCS